MPILCRKFFLEHAWSCAHNELKFKTALGLLAETKDENNLAD